MRDKIKLVSSAGTGFFYTTDKNKRNMPGKRQDHFNKKLQKGYFLTVLCSKN